MRFEFGWAYEYSVKIFASLLLFMYDVCITRHTNWIVWCNCQRCVKFSSKIWQIYSKYTEKSLFQIQFFHGLWFSTDDYWAMLMCFLILSIKRFPRNSRVPFGPFLYRIFAFSLLGLGFGLAQDSIMGCATSPHTKFRCRVAIHVWNLLLDCKT